MTTPISANTKCGTGAIDSADLLGIRPSQAQSVPTTSEMPRALSGRGTDLLTLPFGRRGTSHWHD